MKSEKTQNDGLNDGLNDLQNDAGPSIIPPFCSFPLLTKCLRSRANRSKKRIVLYLLNPFIMNYSTTRHTSFPLSSLRFTVHSQKDARYIFFLFFRAIRTVLSIFISRTFLLLFFFFFVIHYYILAFLFNFCLCFSCCSVFYMIYHSPIILC